MAARIPAIVHNGTTTLYPIYGDPHTHISTLVVGSGKPNFGETLPYTALDVTVSASDVVGIGTYNVDGGTTLEFLHGVEPGQKIELNGSIDPVHLTIDDPGAFHGHVDMNYFYPTNGGPFFKTPPGAEQITIAMSMLGRAVDSYNYHDDMLMLWSGKRVVQSLSLTVHDPFGITVQKAKGWIVVSANDRTSHGVPLDSHGITLNRPDAQITGFMPLHHV
jgi:hypothetical protein